jgi:MerR family redox-sensitive transcriptional activator SoxR
MAVMTIGEVAQRAGVRPSALRYYESIGLLPAARKVNGQRRYDPNILPTLGIIRMAQRAGFTIAEIQALFHDFPADAPPSARWQKLAQRKLTEVEDLMRRAATMKTLLLLLLECRCKTLDECFECALDAAR